MCRGESSVEDWWTMCVPSSPSGERELVMDHSHSGQNQEVGN